MQMLTGSTSKDEQNRIFQKMERGGGSGEKELRVSCALPVDSSVENPLIVDIARLPHSKIIICACSLHKAKLILQPEKVSKSKRLMSVLEKANSGKRLRESVGLGIPMCL